jgi:hypothetical protein
MSIFHLIVSSEYVSKPPLALLAHFPTKTF